MALCPLGRLRRIEISYLRLVALTDAELGTLAPIVRAIRSEAGIGISIARVIYG